MSDASCGGRRKNDGTRANNWDPRESGVAGKHYHVWWPFRRRTFRHEPEAWGFLMRLHAYYQQDGWRCLLDRIPRRPPDCRWPPERAEFSTGDGMRGPGACEGT